MFKKKWTSQDSKLSLTNFKAQSLSTTPWALSSGTPTHPLFSTSVTPLTRALKTSCLNCSSSQVGLFPSSLPHHHLSYMATWIFLQLSSRYGSPPLLKKKKKKPTKTKPFTDHPACKINSKLLAMVTTPPDPWCIPLCHQEVESIALPWIVALTTWLSLTNGTLENMTNLDFAKCLHIGARLLLPSLESWVNLCEKAHACTLETETFWRMEHTWSPLELRSANSSSQTKSSLPPVLIQLKLRMIFIEKH